MAFSAGTKLGVYEVVGPLGAGGMGEVYRAKDPKLKREVAVKVLPEALSRDTDRIARFEREAEVLASLNHPHIAAIYGFEQSGESRFLVLELVEGETLADKLQGLRAKGAGLPLDEALGIATQIADALEAAHEKGIVHRDLKPANVKLTPEGQVKVLDFGLAKYRAGAAGDAGVAGLTHSPTMMGASMPGVILGTAAYMSPEQAKGVDADRTSDVWAFGCVLYEMLTGRRVFEGETVSELIAEVLKTEPDWSRLPADTPESVCRLVRRCLQKDRKQRLQHIGDARIEISEARNEPILVSQAATGTSPRRERIAWIAALVIVTAMAAALAVSALRPVAPLPETRLEIVTPPTTSPESLAISPDGRKIVFAATADGQSRLWLRSLDSVSAAPLRATDGAIYPFWSPDSRSIGFFADGKLERIDIDGGSVQTLASAPGSRGGAWNRDGVILFVPLLGSAILRVSATGGDPVPVTQLMSQQTAHRFPQFLPDGRHFLYYVIAGGSRGVYVGELGRPETRRLIDADAAAIYVSSGHLLFARQGTLFAQPFDARRLELTGDPFQAAEQVAVQLVDFVAALSASAAGPIVYRAGGIGGRRQFVWFDRSGQELGKLGEADSSSPLGMALSPDGRRAAVTRSVNGNSDIWLIDTQRGVLSRFTFDSATESMPVWSSDGSHIAFNSNRKGVFDLYQKSATGAGAEDLLVETTQIKSPSDWSPDGRFLLYRSLDPKTNYDLWALPLEGDRKPFPFVQTAFDERDGQFSPDGKWIAYQSNETGRFEIYAQPFPGPGAKFQVSTSGGAQVRWRRDGKELFYIALDGRLTAVPIQLAANGQTVDAGAPAPLFVTHVGGAVQFPWTQQYAVAADGQRFLMNTVAEEATSPITVILNWRGRPQP